MFGNSHVFSTLRPPTPTKKKREKKKIVHIIQNSIPAVYDSRVLIRSCNPDQVPYLPIQILYLIARALPRPRWVYNLARVNRETWYYLQPALFECEVTYEARLEERFGNGDREDEWGECSERSGSGEEQGQNKEPTTRDDGSRGHPDQCRHGLRTALCEECGEKIAIEEHIFNEVRLWEEMDCYLLASMWRRQYSHLTALHWACKKGDHALPVALKAIRAASAHQPSYIDGVGLRLRQYGYTNDLFGTRIPLLGEFPSPLFIAVEYGNQNLAEVLIEAGCNLNLIHPKEMCADDELVYFKIHESCMPADGRQGSHWGGETLANCQTAGHLAVEHNEPSILKLLLDRGLDPYLGTQPKLYTAILVGNIPAINILLDHSPESSQTRWLGVNPLHKLSFLGQLGMNRVQQEEVRTIASNLVQKGAMLEEETSDSSTPGPLTPLQFSLQQMNAWQYDQGPAPYVAEALIQLGSVWNQLSSSSGSLESILDHCISKATLWSTRELYNVDYHDKMPVMEYCISFARLVKAMTKNIPACVLELRQKRNNIPPMEAFLKGFNGLARKSIEKPSNYDTIATDVEGKLLLSTGITPHASLVEQWAQSIHKIQKGSTRRLGNRIRRNLWEELLSDF